MSDPSDPSNPLSVDPAKARLAAQIRGTTTRLGGRVYRVAWERLDSDSLLEVIRLLRDIEHERDAAVRRARTNPWGRP